MTQEEIRDILTKHKLWLSGEGGERADLRNVDLRNVDLTGADLRNADLGNAKLRGIKWAQLNF